MTGASEAPFLGRAALVTGAGRGIGREVAIGLASLGASVALLARSKGELDEVAEAVRAAGGRALVIPADVGDPGAIDRAVENVLAQFGVVDILVNNAAVVHPVAASVTVDADEWASALAVNLTGVVRLTFALLPGMLQQGWGRILNVSSGVAERPAIMVGANAYVTSKVALEAHSLNLAAELASSGVTVNVYRPGMVDTAMQGWIRSQPPEKIGAAMHERFVSSYEGGMLITPEESARSMLARLPSRANGEIWDVRDA